MRVLFVAHSFPRAPGDAAGSFLLRLARALRDHDVAVTAVVPHAPGLTLDEELDGVRVVRYRYAPARRETLAYTGTMAEQVAAGVGGKLALAGLLAAGAHATGAVARRWGADVVHAHWWFPGGVSAAAARLLGRPLVTTAHGSDVRLLGALPGGRAILRAVARRSARMTAVSRWLAAQLSAAAPGLDVAVAPMPADADRFRPHGDPARARLLFVGRLNAQKGLAHLLRAMAATTSRIPLDVVADGPDRDALQALAGSLGLASRVAWLGARAPGELADLYRHAAAVVMPSTGEGLGLVAVEAQLSGTPVIAFASGGLVDVVRDGETGVLVPPSEPMALAAAIDRVVTDRAYAGALAAAARPAALRAFAPAAAAASYASIYREARATRRA
ncbi:MAG: hypothetical protein AVDCRST_MAG11-2246 [uncultured Gemmatimonadaceae bacterium]|uniref:Glycosyltransferase n=1 Tax=uncultured Gemmatimonadaceae bacterium TaxID=246130 RepID=A0A6J4LA21_9BACT|nr:MAG: hypothetical protein AVDCRST_MAG11-2246 [uncultured Gemmatimonadaceae bacterium]